MSTPLEEKCEQKGGIISNHNQHVYKCMYVRARENALTIDLLLMDITPDYYAL